MLSAPPQVSSSLALCGHFTVGERIDDAQLASVKAATQLSDVDIAVLVNDIDVKRKLQFFQIGGRELLIKHYGSRKRCGTTKPLCELPDFDEIPEIIDWEFYEQGVMRLEETDKDLNAFVREDLVGPVVLKRLEDYGFAEGAVRVFTERELRNVASMRLSMTRKDGDASWISALEKTGLLEELRARGSNIPVCGSIMLALYERVAALGYRELYQYYAEADREAIENGTRLNTELHAAFPNDSRWSLELHRRYF